MPALTWQEKLNQKTLYEMGYQYLIENFHKMKEDNKIKVALDVLHIFNKDGSKTQPGGIVINYNVNGKRKSISVDSPEQVFSASEPTNNSQLPL